MLVHKKKRRSCAEETSGRRNPETMPEPSYDSSIEELIAILRKNVPDSRESATAKAILDVKGQEAIANQTRHLVCATRALVIATVGLVVATIALVFVTLCR